MASLVLLAGGGFGNAIKSLFGSLLSPTKASQAELVSSPPLSALPTPTPIASPPYAKAPMHGSPDTVMTDLSISNSPEILRKNSGCIAEAGVISGRFANINSSFGPQPATHPNPRIRRCQSAIVSQDPNFFPDSDVAAGASTSVPSNLMLFRHRTFPPADDLEPGQTVNNFSAPRASPARVGKVRSFNVGYNMSLSDTY